MYPLRNMVDQRYQASQDAIKQGKPVAWCMIDFGIATPFLEAMDIATIFPENYGPVCAVNGVVGGFLDRATAEGFPNHMCGYCRNCLGYSSIMQEIGEVPPQAPSGGMPKPALLMATGRVCDAHFKTFQAAARYLDSPMWIIDQPQPGEIEALLPGSYERDVKYMVGELKEFAKFLERLMGRKMDWNKYETIVNGRIEVNKIWYEINEMRKAVPGPMHARDFWSSMSAAIFGGADYEVNKKLFHDMYDEVKYRVDNKISAINFPEKYRMTFYVLPPWHSLGFFDKLAERGWNFVIEEAYHPPKPRNLQLISDPVERSVRFCIPGLGNTIEDNFPEAEAADIKKEILKKGYSHRLTVKQAQDYKVDGALLQPLLTCRAYTLHQPSISDQLLKMACVPSMSVEGDTVDVSLFDPEAALRRADAFEEQMDHFKEVREKGCVGVAK